MNLASESRCPLPVGEPRACYRRHGDDSHDGGARHFLCVALDSAEREAAKLLALLDVALASVWWISRGQAV